MIDALDIDLTPVVAEQPDPVLFATVSGAWFGNRSIVMSPRLVLRTAC